MKTLLDRETVLEMVAHLPDLAAEMSALEAVTPQVVCNISGGILQGASADFRVDVYALDFDHDGCDPSEMIDVDGSSARLDQAAADFDPDFVKRVLDAPTLDESED